MHSGRDTVDSACDSGVEVSGAITSPSPVYVSGSVDVHLPSRHTSKPTDDDQAPAVTQVAPPQLSHDPLQLFETDDDGDT